MLTPPLSLPTSLSELVFPFQPTLSQTLTSLKKSRLGIHKRLTSILEDSVFVASVSEANRLPLIANERCGSWYVPPEQKHGSVYFKSTDGHQGQWQFSLRRLNLGLLELLSEHGGAVVVDSTRRGKSMPDALSKTIAIWAAVMNRMLFPEKISQHGLLTPEDVVGRSEHSQIEERLDDFVRNFQTLDLDLVKLRSILGLPIKVEFVSRQTSIVKIERSAEQRLLICCSASKHEHGDGDNYVQGAGDDTENWAHGLTADLFWSHKDLLLKETNEENLQSLIENILAETRNSHTGSITCIHLQNIPTPLFLGSSLVLASIDSKAFDAVVHCEKQTPDHSNPTTNILNPPVLELGCSPGKLGGKSLRDKLPLVESFLQKIIEKAIHPRVLILCSKNNDISIGVALAILCRFVGTDGIYTSERRQGLDKKFVRQQLACIIQSVPGANPSRAALQSVNAYLMGYTG